jgi:nucleoside-diphosphate-sugar epimerase
MKNDQFGKKKILITGGCGFVGRHLVARLAKEPGNELWVVDDLSTGVHPSAWVKPVAVKDEKLSENGREVFVIKDTAVNLIYINADFLSLALSELGRQGSLGYPQLPQFDEIYHLASVVGGRVLIDEEPLIVGIDLAIDSCFFLWATKVNKPKHIMYASSSAAYPISLQTDSEALALKEEMIDFDKGFQQPDYTYGWSKLTGEYLSRIAVKKHGMKVAIVRPFSGYGEDQDLTYPVPSIALRVANHQAPVKVWGSGEQGRDFVHIDDCVDACVLACRTISDASAVNIGSGVLTSFKELAALFVELEGYQTEVVGVADRPVGVSKRYSDNSNMKKILNWSPAISLREGMQRVLVGAHERLNKGIKPAD